MSEHAVQSAYLIGCGDPQSQRGRPAPFDTNRLARALQTVKQVAQSIADGQYTPTQLINVSIEIIQLKLTSSGRDHGGYSLFDNCNHMS